MASHEPPSSSGKSESGKNEPNPLILLGVAGEVGLVVAGATVLGWWLDEQWGTRPWLMLTGVVIGLVGGMYNLWRVARKFF